MAPPELSGVSIAEDDQLLRLVHELSHCRLEICRTFSLSKAVFICIFSNSDADLEGDLADFAQGRVERTSIEIFVADELCEFSSGRKEHAGRHRLGLGEHYAETKSREDVAVVALTRHKGASV